MVGKSKHFNNKAKLPIATVQNLGFMIIKEKDHAMCVASLVILQSVVDFTRIRKESTHQVSKPQNMVTTRTCSTPPVARLAISKSEINVSYQPIGWWIDTGTNILVSANFPLLLTIRELMGDP